MKTIIIAVALAAAIASPVQAACIRARDITGTDSKDGRLMTFKMKDGRVLVNHLQGICSDLRFEGFVWTVHGTDDICEYQQTFKVINSGQTCTLGKFDVVKEKRSAP